MTSARLNVLIVSAGRRLEQLNLDALPVIDGVSYKISCQAAPDTRPDISHLLRDDIEIRFFNDKGISVNRNHSLDMADAPAVLLADDDTFFHRDGLAAVAHIFAENPELDYAAFRCRMPGHEIYPPDRHNLATPFPFYGPVSIELAFRINSLRQHSLQFNRLAGIGAPYLTAGEEDLLLLHCRREGLKGQFFNILVVTHPEPSTGLKAGDNTGFLRAKGALMRLTRGNTAALLRIPVETLRARGNKVKACINLLQGFWYSVINRHKL